LTPGGGSLEGQGHDYPKQLFETAKPEMDGTGENLEGQLVERAVLLEIEIVALLVSSTCLIVRLFTLVSPFGSVIGSPARQRSTITVAFSGIPRVLPKQGFRYRSSAIAQMCCQPSQEGAAIQVLCYLSTFTTIKDGPGDLTTWRP
jgi:hypothetical protein